MSLLFCYLFIRSYFPFYLSIRKCGGTPATHNSTLKVDCKQDVTGIPGVVQYVYSDPNLQSYPQFVVGGQSPVDIRRHYDHAIRYICQPSWPNIQAQDTYYATMFDECYGIAVLICSLQFDLGQRKFSRTSRTCALVPNPRLNSPSSLFQSVYKCNC